MYPKNKGMYAELSEWGVSLYTDNGELIGSCSEDKIDSLADLAADLAYDFWGGEILKVRVGTVTNTVEVSEEAWGTVYRAISYDSRPIYGTTNDSPCSWRKACATREEALEAFKGFLSVDLRMLVPVSSNG